MSGTNTFDEDITLSIHLKLIVVDRLRSSGITTSEFSKLFYDAISRRREKIKQAADSEELFNFPSGRQLINMRSNLYRAIFDDRKPLSFVRFRFIIEDMLHEKLPEDHLIDEAESSNAWKSHPEGRNFGRLNCIRRVGCPKTITNDNHRRYYLWQCSCGNVTTTSLASVLSGHTKSCGCLRSEMVKHRFTKHGMYDAQVYSCWEGVVQRCTNVNHKNYPHYGGRGIKVCDRWRNSFENFYADMGDMPPDMTLDRIDNDGNYEPGNCRWATSKEQGRNKRSNRLIEGKPMVVWCEENSLRYHGVLGRLYRLRKSGMTDGEATEAIIRYYKFDAAL